MQFKPTARFSSAVIGCFTFLLVISSSPVFAGIYPVITFNTGKGSSATLESMEIVSSSGQGGACTGSEIIFSPGETNFQLSCPETNQASTSGKEGGKLIFQMKNSQGAEIGRCQVGFYYDYSGGYIYGPTLTGQNNSDQYGPSYCDTPTLQVWADTLNEDEESGIHISTNEFFMHHKTKPDMEICTKQSASSETYCTSHAAYDAERIYIDSEMQPEDGLKAKDAFCIAFKMGSNQQYEDHYFSLNQDAPAFQANGIPVRVAGTRENPGLSVDSSYKNMFTPLDLNENSPDDRQPCGNWGNKVWVD